jgi:hypothetical protein
VSPALHPLHGGPPTPSFDRVRRSLDQIRDDCRGRDDRNGFFAAMYGRVTAAVQARAAQGRFDDAQRMEVFVARFARRYTDAYWAHAGGRPTTQSWGVAFDAAAASEHLVLQHLALGMNAHINLDLGVVAVEAAPSVGSLDALRGDLLAINEVLAELVDRCQAVVAASPVLAAADCLLDTHDESASRFSLEVARAGAWHFAESLAAAEPVQREQVMARRDAAVAGVGRRLLTKGGPVDFARRVIRAGEWRPVDEVIDLLAAVDVS